MFNYQVIEKKWQKIWDKEGIYKTKDKVRNKKNFYHLVMFPYPSGDLHIGHWYNFAPADVYARIKKMQGYNVLSPIGFDSFGLPAENAAIKRGIHPKDWTYKNIKTMTKQLESMGNIYDWSRMVITSDPEYYKWTQWMFLQFYKNGLAYKKKAPANWCPKCHTVLANEQVVDGKCERCDTVVVQRDIEQWLFKITDYAEKLLGGLDRVDWPEKTKTMQKNWIGKSEGVMIKFKVKSSKLKVDEKIEVFTTRVDTILGCTYVVVAPEHLIIQNNELGIKNYGEVKDYIKKAKNKTDLQRTDLAKDKTGVELSGIKAINPFNKEEVPVFVADYVLGHYGAGAVMAVPAHDSRDWDFAKKYKLPIKIVICPNYPAPKCPILEKAYEEDGYLINSGQFTGLTSEKAREKMAKWLEENKFGRRKINYKLRDWLISRQRYWGSPIPIIYCDKCGIVPVPEKDLPIKLPNVKNYLPTEEGKSPLAHSEKFVNAKCPKCGGKAKRETDTMDTFVCSSWYYLRYADPKNKKKFARAQKIKAWLPVNMYIGGTEHSVLHLLYSRFFTKALKDFGYLNFDEPFSSLRHQGIILGPDGQKMSKSRGNVIDPDELVRNFGVDAVRMYLCFMGEYSQGGPWNPTGILGVHRFLQRVYKKVQSSKFKVESRNAKSKNDKLERLLHQTIKKVTEDIENFRFNTAISALMILFNEMEHANSAPSPKGFGNANAPMRIEILETFLKLLAPFAPHLTEEIWRNILGNKKSIHLESWPKYNPKLIKEEKFELVVQINGKVRDKVLVEAGIAQKEAEEIVLKLEKIKKILVLSEAEGIVGRKIKKIIYVHDRLINIVV